MKDEGRWTMNYTVRLDQSSEQVTTRLMDALQQQGLQVTVSFDLRLVLFQTGFDKHSSCDKLKAKMP
jgi:uncharacterized protein (DUF302 family)